MPPHVTLTGVTPDDLFAWLPECIALVRQELALHPLRPQPSAMLPYRVPIHQLYLFARRLAGWYVGIYEVLPDASPPFGTPLMLLAGELYDTPAQPGELHVGIWRTPRFPLDIPEIAWLLEERFPSKPAPASPLAPFTRPADLGRPGIVTPPSPPAATPPPGYRLPPDAPAEHGAEPPPAGDHGTPTLPGGLRRDSTLPSTFWLTEQIAALPEPVDPEPLYQPWAKRYEACVGLIPRDSARSFNRALDTAFKQAGRTRRRRRR